MIQEELNQRNQTKNFIKYFEIEKERIGSKKEFLKLKERIEVSKKMSWFHTLPLKLRT